MEPQPRIQIHLCFFLVILLMFICISWYNNYEPVLESVFDQFKILLIVSPLFLLLILHFLSDDTSTFGSSMAFPNMAVPEKDSLHRAGGTPWGVAFVLVLLFFMLSYQTSLKERWFPLLNR